jgi:hypothetical protein
MALYRHIGSAESLHAGVVGALLTDFPVAEWHRDWRADVRAWATEARAVLAGVPGLAHLVLREWLDLEAALRAVESLVALFADHGPKGADAVAAANAVFTYVLMRAQAEEAVRIHGARRNLAELRRRRDELPRMWQHRQEYAEARIDRHFAFGLDAILRGLA